MENTPKVHRRLSTTLSNRLHQKRHSSSPQSHRGASVADSPAPPVSPTAELNNCANNVECTPPNKKTLSMDDSVDFSPRLDISLSPSCMFSQTLATESPEVGWRWNRNSNSANRRNNRVNTTADSGFNSAETAERNFRERCKQKTENDNGYVARRNQQDNEQWRAQQIRARELLKERCNKLHKQLEQVASSSKLSVSANAIIAAPITASASAPMPNTSTAGKRSAIAAKLSMPSSISPPAATLCHDSALNDFLNDSDTDCLLLEATQQVETKFELSQQIQKPTIRTTPTSHKKEQRPSFYMKFLEDEVETEDWLAGLDEAVLLATQAKKPRTSLQRYKSMPSTDTPGETKTSIVNNAMAKGTRSCNTGANSTTNTFNQVHSPRMRRHASSNVLSPVTSHVRSRLLGSRK
ncbi:uncharacterized protein LOC115621361 [Scaptodrosophila lebanonensis]|uniref:Uncharacterized protein LOC115621361 n=1 Tax=Drosophila lebanonensis TaxID=7225 RepID=A0A6J2T6E5_DROLE|nr:uncharacterized protein LOC115621361 [Scaptodrosophila lebanonensis]